MELNSRLLFDNIYYLINKKNIRIGDLETNVGVSTGYISRTSKESNSKPGIDFILNVSNFLEVSVDTLVKFEFSKATSTEEYLISFFEKIKKDTIQGDLDWMKHTQDELNHEEPDINGYLSHPLMQYKTFMDMGENNYPEEVTRNVMVSKTFGYHTVIAGNCYSLKMANGVILHLMSICQSIHEVDDKEAYAKEAWMTSNGKMDILATDRSEHLGYLIDGLYQSLETTNAYPRLNSTLRYAIDSYLENGINEADYSENDLPF
ncbi:helix-turn-helix domain-containing protein [Aerococcus urinae]